MRDMPRNFKEAKEIALAYKGKDFAHNTRADLVSDDGQEKVHIYLHNNLIATFHSVRKKVVDQWVEVTKEKGEEGWVYCATPCSMEVETDEYVPSITLYSAGWTGPLTKKRLSAMLSGNTYGITQENWVWYVVGKWNMETHKWDYKEEFYEGFTVPTE